jgi:hypothetical protein
VDASKNSYRQSAFSSQHFRNKVINNILPYQPPLVGARYVVWQHFSQRQPFFFKTPLPTIIDQESIFHPAIRARGTVYVSFF